VSEDGSLTGPLVLTVVLGIALTHLFVGWGLLCEVSKGHLK
jgi:hypothetical protein